MGVSGCGKTTIGEQLALEQGLPFFDADDFHPKANIEKMNNNVALSDADRLPWIHTLAEKTYEWETKEGAVLACSALKESYRAILASKQSNILWVYLSGTFELISARLKKRSNHYMKSALLQSQFDTLEVPDYGLHINIENSIDDIIKGINSKLKQMNQSVFGVIGLGVMGKSLSLNIAEKGFDISVYNRPEYGEEQVVSNFLKDNHAVKNISGFTDLQPFVASLATPRKILIMIKAGKAIDMVIDQLIPFLSKGDIIVDGGNSHYMDTAKRVDYLAGKELHFVGCGISGGEEGARKGPSMMPGGSLESYQNIAPILETISAKDKTGKPCCTYIGPDGTGHFVKMVHNGIEYAEMQLLAEVYAIMKISMDNEKMAQILSDWKTTDLSSYLLEITIDILQKKEGNQYVLDTILDAAGNKGTGSWSSKAAFDLGSVNTMMSSAVFARYLSAFKQKRESLSFKIKNDSEAIEEPNIKALENAYRFARVINHYQGFELIRLASIEYKWKLNLSEIARIWTNGCIIRSDFMEQSVDTLKAYENYFEDQTILKSLMSSESSITECISYSLKYRIPFDTFWSAYNYWISITTENLSAHLIQAQRDYFGAHTYQRKDDSSLSFYHTNWLEK